MKKIYFFFVILILVSNISYTAENEPFDGEGGREDLSFLNEKNSNFKKGEDALKQASKYKNKNKITKSNNRLEKALEYFILANKENPENIDVLRYLGLTYYLLDDLMMSEIYYQQALDIDPKNSLIHLKLGEIYVATQRENMALKSLKILANCNCKEYGDLKKFITKKKN